VRFTRRRFLWTTGAAGIALAAGRAADRAHAQGLRPITLTHSVSTFVYGQHLVAKEKKLFEAEGVSVPGLIVPGGGAKVVQALAAPPAEDHREGP
jgi:ABC-type nitrate/sulfonate/bicarbonate transport system substrate-binding protein